MPTNIITNENQIVSRETFRKATKTMQNTAETRVTIATSGVF